MIGSVAGRGLSAADDGLRVRVVQSRRRVRYKTLYVSSL